MNNIFNTTTNELPLQRFLVAINSRGNAMILASEGEIISDARTYNGDYEIPVSLPPENQEGLLIWEGTVHFFSDGEEQWNGNWRYADCDEVEHWRWSNTLLPNIDTLEKAIEYLNLKDKISAISELTEKLFGVIPTLKYEKSYPIGISFNLLVDAEEDEIGKLVKLESKWSRLCFVTGDRFSLHSQDPLIM
jgi:hypothetical protein